MKGLYYSILLMIAAGCVDTIELKTAGQHGTLIVDGWIYDEAGPYFVKLARSVSYDNTRTVKVYNIPESGAVVSLVDSDGRQYAIKESQPGTYQSSALMGEVGKSYQVAVQTSDGKRYNSSFEQIRPVTPIDQIKAKFEVSESLFFNANGDARIQELETFVVTVSTTDPAQATNFYRWQMDGIFEFFSNIPDPDLRHCWAPLFRLEGKVQIASDLTFNGNPYEQRLGLVIYDRPTKFLVKIRQYSLTQRAYNFLKGIHDQQSATGTLFDPPPANVVGNITCVTNPEETVVGFFGASGVSRSQLLIDRLVESGFDVPPAHNVPIRAGDCRTQEPFATNIKPEGF